MENSAAPNWSVIGLTEVHIEALVEHYMQLSYDDLCLRFCAGLPKTPERLRERMKDVVEGMFAKKVAEHFGIVDPADGKALIGVACWGPCRNDPKIADFGVSVLPAWRGKGLTEALADHACIDAIRAGCTTMRVDYLLENAPVQQLLSRLNQFLPLNWVRQSATLSLQPYAEEARRQLGLLAALLEVVGPSIPTAKL